MPRPPAEPTSTISVCVSPAEQNLIREAASADGASVSAWAAGALAASLAGNAPRAAVVKAAQTIAAAMTPRGTRSARVSVVLRQRDHLAVTEAAAKLKLSPHAMVQAALLESANVDLAKLSPVKRQALTAGVRAAHRQHSFAVHLPADLAEGVDRDRLAQYLDALARATAVAILDGKGRAIAEGVQKMAAKYATASLVMIPLDLPEMTMAAPAHVLDVSASAYATTLAVKAVRAMAREDA